MLKWVTAGSGPRFGLIVYRTEGERTAYDRVSSFDKLDKVLDLTEKMVDRKADWVRVFPEQPAR